MIDIARLQHRASQYGVALSQPQLQKMNQYAALLLDWNKRINLTAITNIEDVENKHFVDSLLLAMQPELAGSVVDVGSGAGFPGLVTQIYRPELQLTLIEPTGKRVRFLQEVMESLQLGTTVLQQRAEEAARKQWREGFDVVTARAVAPMPVLCEYCLPLVKQNGHFIAMKGENAGAELAQALPAIEMLGGIYSDTRQYHLPDGAARNLIVIKKVKPTPPKYPRNGGTIRKAPL